MTCTPAISVKKGSWDTQDGGLFATSSATVVLTVDYCGSDVAEGCTEADWPDRGAAVVSYIGYQPNNLWDIRIGRPLSYYDGGVWNTWIDTFTADQTAAEIAASPSTKSGWIVKSVSTRQVNAGHKGLWEVTINLSSMTLQSTGQYPNMSVDVTTQTRLARAFRAGSTLLVPTTNTGASGPKIGTVASGSFDSTNWRNGLAATMDVVGIRLDINAQPVTIAVEQKRIAISFVIRKPYIGDDPTVDTIYKNSMWTTWAINGSDKLNKRNEAALFGYGIGELVCESVNISSIDDQFSRCEVVLLWDEWGHFDQNAWGINGTVPDLSDDPGMAVSPDRPVTVANTVFWTTSFHESFTLATTDFPRDVWDVASIAIT